MQVIKRKLNEIEKILELWQKAQKIGKATNGPTQCRELEEEEWTNFPVHFAHDQEMFICEQ